MGGTSGFGLILKRNRIPNSGPRWK